VYTGEAGPCIDTGRDLPRGLVLDLEEPASALRERQKGFPPTIGNEGRRLRRFGQTPAGVEVETGT